MCFESHDNSVSYSQKYYQNPMLIHSDEMRAEENMNIYEMTSGIMWAQQERAHRMQIYIYMYNYYHNIHTNKFT